MVKSIAIFVFFIGELSSVCAASEEGQAIDPWLKLEAVDVWASGYCGEHVRVGVFDTGIVSSHRNFERSHIADITDWTSDDRASLTIETPDGHGHGSFVAGLIAGCPDFSIAKWKDLAKHDPSEDCSTFGISPSASLHIFRVFTDKQLSFTSWFLDAFNYAIAAKLHVINLSVGGPDFLDEPFVSKVQELSANGILLVSAIGNDGPFFGSLKNPADQFDVLGVGGIDSDGEIASFSSRGMTGWETRNGGYGRVKPDIVTWAKSIRSVKFDDERKCLNLSGTSVASPIVTGACTLLFDALQSARDHYLKAKLPYRMPPMNPAAVRQAISAGAKLLGAESGVGRQVSMYEQGAGLLQLRDSLKIAMRLKAQASLFPSYLDLTDCPYMWPHCEQPLYATGLPTIVNVTVTNSMGVSGWLADRPVFHPFLNSNGNWLVVATSYPDVLWPWSGWLGLSISVDASAPGSEHFTGLAEGYLSFTIVSPGSPELTTALKLPIRVRVVPTPPKSKRILWDQFRNIGYPPLFVPRDDILSSANPLDTLGDHLHTNFGNLFTFLRREGYFVEILSQPLTCIDLQLYGIYVVADPEEEYHPDEARLLHDAIDKHQLSLVVFADWHNPEIGATLSFYDPNMERWWTPDIGGSNLPALNDLLSKYGFQFGNRVYDGQLRAGNQTLHFASGTSLLKVPGSGETLVWRSETGFRELAIGRTGKLHLRRVKSMGPILLSVHRPVSVGFGAMAVFGDSSCLETQHGSPGRACLWLLKDLLQYVTVGIGGVSTQLRGVLRPAHQLPVTHNSDVPQRNFSDDYLHFSRVLASHEEGGALRFKELTGLCFHLDPVLYAPIRGSSPTRQPLLLHDSDELDQAIQPHAADSATHFCKRGSLKGEEAARLAKKGRPTYALKQWAFLLIWEYVLGSAFFMAAIYLILKRNVFQHICGQLVRGRKGHGPVPSQANYNLIRVPAFDTEMHRS